MTDEEPKFLKKVDSRTIDRSKMVPQFFKRGVTGKEIVEAMLAKMKEAADAEEKAKAEADKKPISE